MEEYAEAIDELIEIASLKGKITKSAFQKLVLDYGLDESILGNKFKLYKGKDWFDFKINRPNSSSALKTSKGIARARVSQNPEFYNLYFKPSCGVHAKSLDDEIYVYVGFRINGTQGEIFFEDNFHEVIVANSRNTVFVDWVYLYAKAPKLVDKIYNAL